VAMYIVFYQCMFVVHKYVNKLLLILLLASCRDLLPTANSKVRLIEGGVNNLPDDHSYRAAMEIYDLLQSMTEDDLVLTLVSGMFCFVLCSNLYVI